VKEMPVEIGQNVQVKKLQQHKPMAPWLIMSQIPTMKKPTVYP
jgi:hypothetical protein